MKKLIYIFLFLTLNVAETFAQYPYYFQYDSENGLPSNEVYSVVQDKKGFIWIGCDAGLFKFDGVRYVSYNNKTQNSKSITGLTISSSGILYGYNFQSQIFYLENDPSTSSGQALKEIKADLAKVNRLACDNNGNVFVSHSTGVSQYNEQIQKWTHVQNTESTPFVSSVNIHNDKLFFITSQGLGELVNGKMNLVFNYLFNPVGTFILRNANNKQFIFSTFQNGIYEIKNGEVYVTRSENLLQILNNRKITNASFLADNHLWISTYKGIVKYNPENDSTTLLFPELSFSDCLLDREGNYWFTTLQNGIIRVPNLNFIVWDKENEFLKNDKITKITTDGINLFFTTVNGTVGVLHSPTNQLKTFHTGNNSDVQSLDYDFKEKLLYFHIDKHLYFLQNGKVSEKPNDITTLKSIRKIKEDYFLLCSFGVDIQGKENYRIYDGWARELQYDEKNNTVWIATNKGILKCSQKNEKWIVNETFLDNTQVLSIDFDKSTNQIFALTFNGSIYSNNVAVAQLPENVQGNKLNYFDNKIYIASNNGVWIFDLTKQQWSNLNTLSGLASNNVQGLVVLNSNLWLATGKGLQKIPLIEIKETPLAKIYLKNHFQFPTARFELNYDEALFLNPEASIYSSNGKFEYAYRINKGDWLKLPSIIEQIEIQHIPSGNFEIELKAIDHLGRDSENTITLKGYVNPPFWETGWFYGCLTLAGIIVSILISRAIIKNIKRKELAKNQLINSQLKAIRAQMNPHFMYNTLNSIQDLILQNDIKNTNYYLSKFSLLMRQILDFSEEETVLLSEETEMLKNYLELEKLRFGSDFTFSLNIAENIDISRTYIPSLIVQPYVENAVKHGLLHKKGFKKLDITFHSVNEFLEIRIEDNGIGRKRSAEIKQRSGILHKSFSGNAVQKRLALLNNNNKQKIEVIISNINEKEEDTGTRVTIILSVNSKQLFVNG